jgi:hypothetical protein
MEFYLPKARRDKYPSAFTLKEFDYKGLPSMRQLFLKYEDPVGYFFAKEVLGSYEHWKVLCATPWFKEHLDDWLMELEAQRLAEGIRKAGEIAQGDGAAALNASKYLAEKGWEPKKGRPRKVDVERETKKQASVASAVEEDFLRVVGGKDQ